MDSLAFSDSSMLSNENYDIIKYLKCFNGYVSVGFTCMV
jgi:hypothetical protein